jgi:aminomuconate-semialdehyde/2-hydroxymuconate-6-semialdehyde dehydrogenase
MDIPRAAYNFRFFAGALLHAREHAMKSDSGALSYISRAPVGVAGLISPWNLPLYLLTWKIAPAIAFGNTAVCKPSEFTSFTASILCDIFAQAKLPDGVVNMIFGTGPEAGAPLVAHPDVPLISFTGGTVTGRAIAQVAAPLFKKLSLELGGIYVERSIYDKFLTGFIAKVKDLKVGDPADPKTFIGPVVSKEHLEKIETYLSLARAEGVEILAGGSRAKFSGAMNKGYFLQPTVLSGVKHESRLQQEEIFGPVVTVTPFDREDEVIDLANGTKYGLSASIWTKSLKRAHEVGEKLHAGTVWVNTWMLRDLRAPFGGVKASGVGREGQEESREFFTEAKTICIMHGGL